MSTGPTWRVLMPQQVTLPLVMLVAANTVPLFGVLFLGWSVLSILVLYWIENVVIGILNVPKILACRGSLGGKLFIIPFFAFHYGFFCYGHGVFITGMFNAPFTLEGLLFEEFYIWASLSFVISHGASMLLNFFGRREYAGREINVQMFMPYGRIVIMHIVILIGGLLVQAIGAPILALFVLIALKTVMDLVAHKIEHEGLDGEEEVVA